MVRGNGKGDGRRYGKVVAFSFFRPKRNVKKGEGYAMKKLLLLLVISMLNETASR